MKRWIGAYAVALGLICSVPQAQAQAVDRVQEQNGITFVSGGIGEDSRSDLAAREKSYNFKLVTTLDASSGSFVSGVRVVLATAKGDKLIEHVTEGPIMLAGLPAGAYVVIASFRGITHTRKFQVRAERLHTEILRWPVDPAQDVVTPIDR